MLRQSEAGTEGALADEATLLVRDSDEQLPATLPPGVTTQWELGDRVSVCWRPEHSLVLR